MVNRESMKTSLQVFLLIMFCSLLSVTITYGQVEQAYVVNLTDGAKWLPNTELIQGWPAFSHDNRYWFFVSKGGLFRYDAKTNQSKIFRIDALSLSNEAWLTGIAKVDKKLWVSTFSIVYVFDMEKMKFTGSFSVMKNNDMRESTNLTLVYDFTDDNIWASTFLHLYSYDIKQEQWINYDDIFKSLHIGEPSSQHIIFIDEDFIWVVAPEHAKSKGALLQFNKKTKQWNAFNEEIAGLELNNIEVDLSDIISSQQFVWVGPFYYENHFVFPVYDKKNDSWKIYHSSEFDNAIELLIESLPNVRWLGKLSIIENEGLEANVKKLRDALEELGISKYVNLGMYKNMVQGSKILARDEPYGMYYPVSELKLPQISYKRIIRSLDDKNVLVETNRGLAVLDTSTYQLKFFTPSVFLQGKIGSFYDRTKQQVLVCEERLDFADKIISIDVANFQWKELIDMPVPMCRESDPIPTLVLMKNGKKISLRWDGLIIE